jgi:hypothetical protein
MTIHTLATFTAAILLASAVTALAAKGATIDAYLIPDQTQEIALARSAAPPALSNEASVMVLTAKGYKTVAEGKNGFTCLVERGWAAPFDGPDFMSVTMKAPVCYNAAAVRSHLPYTINRTRLFLAGKTKDQMRDEIKQQVANKQLPVPELGAMSYMMSKEQDLGENAHWHPHVMFHLPRTDMASWGVNLPGNPVYADPTQLTEPEPETTFFVVVDSWSDGSH